MQVTPRRKQSPALLWYTMCAMWLGIYLTITLRSDARGHVAPLSRILLLLLAALCAYLGARLPRMGETIPCDMRARRVRRAMWLCFALYLHLVLTFTLFDPAMGRDFHSFWHATAADRVQYMRHHINFTPLHTIRTVYLDGYRNGFISRADLLLNLAGNLLVFTPFAFFVPYLLCGGYPALRFALLTLAVILSVELCQLVLMCGICDIDDVILNFSGAAAAYLLLSLPPLRRLTARAFLTA